MKRGLKVTTRSSPESAAGLVEEPSPMKRGLKELDLSVTRTKETVEEPSPMKRGLKDYDFVAG